MVGVDCSAGEPEPVVEDLFGFGPLSGGVGGGPFRMLSSVDVDGDKFSDVVIVQGSSLQIDSGNHLLTTNLGSPVREVVQIGRDPQAGKSTLMARTDAGLHILTVMANGQALMLTATALATGQFGDGFTPSIARGDLDGDGVMDLVTVNVATSQVVVYLGKGDGMLREPLVTQTAAPAGFLRGVKLADLDNDGDLDIGALSSPGGIYPLENSSFGTFEPFSANLPGDSFGGDARSAAAADFNSDGKMDFYRMSVAGQGQLLFGDGAGGFASGPTNNLPSGAANPITGDFDGDGNPDIITANFGHDTLALLRGTGQGTLALTPFIPVGDGPVLVLPMDADGDGDTDLIVSHDGLNLPVGPLFVEHTGGLGTTIFESYLSRPISDARSMTIGDFNGDGRLDVMVSTTNNWLRPLLGTPTGLSASALLSSTNANTPILGALRSADGDPRTLLAFATPDPPRAGFLRLNAGNNMIEPGVTLTPTASPVSVATGDVNDDGRDDLLVSHEGGAPAVTIYPQEPDATFAAPILIDGPGGGHLLVVQDLDGLHGPDLIVGANGLVRFALSTGPATFAGWETISVPDAPSINGIVIGEFDGIPGPDVMIAGASGGDGRVVFGPQLLGGAIGQITFPLPGVPKDIAAADLDGDGLLNFLLPIDLDGVADVLADWEPGFLVQGPITGITLRIAGHSPARVLVGDIHEPLNSRGAELRGLAARPLPEAIVLSTGEQTIGLRGVTVNLNMTEIRVVAPCPGDANGDQVVGFADLNIVVSAFNTESGDPGYDAAADFDGDGDVDFADLNEVLSAFNTEC